MVCEGDGWGVVNVCAFASDNTSRAFNNNNVFFMMKVLVNKCKLYAHEKFLLL